MIYLLVDWKNDKDFFLQKELEERDISVEIIDIPNYNKKDRETTLGSLKLYFKYLKLALNAFKKSSKNDIIICWNFTTSIPVGIINKVLKKKRKIIALNIIAPVRGRFIEKIKNHLFHFALNQKNLYITVNAQQLIRAYSRRFRIPKGKFFVLNDPLSSNYKSRVFIKKESYIFCGGEARRDWSNILKAAEKTPNLSYIFIARKKYFVEKDEIPDNVKLYFDVPVEMYYNLFEESTIVALPLKDENPAGLINLLRAAMLSIPVVSTDTPSIRNYITHNISGFLIGKQNSPQEFADRLNELYHDIQMQREFTNNLKSFVLENFSEKAYSNRLLALIQDNY